MNKQTTYLQTKDLPDSPKGTRWLRCGDDSECFFPKDTGFVCAYQTRPESYLKSHPDFWTEKKKERYKPGEDVRYWSINQYLRIQSNRWWIDNEIDNDLYNNYNVFPTQESAQKAADAVRELLKGIQEEGV